MYVVANNVDSVELLVNGVSKGKMTQAESGYLYAFPSIAFEPGTIKAVGYKAGEASGGVPIDDGGARLRQSS